MGLPIEYVEALFELIPQIVGFVVTLLPIIPVIFIIQCSWTHRCRLCPKPNTDIKGANQVSNQILNQLSGQTSDQILNQISNQLADHTLVGKNTLPPPRGNTNAYKALPQQPRELPTCPPRQPPVTINISNRNNGMITGPPEPVMTKPQRRRIQYW
jgi:hypothetical protein